MVPKVPSCSQALTPGCFRSGAVWAAESRVGLVPGALHRWSWIATSSAGTAPWRQRRAVLVG